MASASATYPLAARTESAALSTALEKSAVQAEIDALVERLSGLLHEDVHAEEHEAQDIEALLDAYETGYAYELRREEAGAVRLPERARTLFDTLSTEVFGYVATSFHALQDVYRRQVASYTTAPAEEATVRAEYLPEAVVESDGVADAFDAEHAAMLRALIARRRVAKSEVHAAQQRVVTRGAGRTLRITWYTLQSLARRFTGPQTID